MTTPRRLETLRVFARLVHQYGYPPTQVEVAKAMDRSKVTVNEHMRCLEAEGLLEATRGRHNARRYRVSDAGREALRPREGCPCAVCGRPAVRSRSELLSEGISPATVPRFIFEESPAYRNAMRDAGRGHLLP